jgi:hypothetical protein
MNISMRQIASSLQSSFATTPALTATTRRFEDPFAIALLLPDGVGFRNFVFGDFLESVASLGPVHLFHLMDDSNLPSEAIERNYSVTWHRLLPFRERPLPFFLRQALTSAQRYWINTPPNLSAVNRPVHGSIQRRTAMRLARWVGRMSASPQRIRRVEQAHSVVMGRSPEVAYFRRVFTRIRPKVVFSSNQNPLFVIAPVLAAKQLGIPTATFIFSWDNLSTKGRIAAPFDHFLVWSSRMKEELLRFYPDVLEKRAHVVGTPQFDCYANKALLVSRAEFCSRIGADPKRPLICFSGGDSEVSKGDHLHVRVLMELIRSAKVHGRPQVLLRPAPSDPGTRYDSVRRDFPELIYAPPAWTRHNSPHGEFFGLMPCPEDVRFLTNLTFHADININFASTMTLDFAIQDKPVVNVMLEVADPPLFGKTMWEFVRGFEHYDPVVELGAARFAQTPEDLANHINSYLLDPSLDREGRRRFVELEVGAPIGGSSQYIVDALRAIVYGS